VGQKKFNLKENTQIESCPKCGQNTEFVAHSMQCSEDCCEIWIKCRCGYDPTEENTGHRMEDVWGSLGKEEITCALDCSWNEPIQILKQLTNGE